MGSVVFDRGWIMDFLVQSVWIFLCVLLSLITECLSVPMANAICGACTMVLTEMEIKIAELEEKNRGKNDHPTSIVKNHDLADKGSISRSEIQLSEILEAICDKTSEWTAVVHPRTGKGVYARRATLKLKQVPEHLTIHQFGDACSDFLDLYEDQLIRFARKKHKEPVRLFCHETIEVCTAVDVAPMTDEESGKAQILNDEEKEKTVEKALDKLKRDAEEMNDEL
uniref:DUF3456 domain-containing protein n=1 Tax=Elaeophora elaphi TaxID=1147741 RepID=A0A0R3RHV7_9BILA